MINATIQLDKMRIPIGVCLGNHSLICLKRPPKKLAVNPIEIAAIDRINRSVDKSACTEKTIDIDNTPIKTSAMAASHPLLDRPKQSQAAIARPTNKARSEVSKGSDPMTVANRIPEPLPMKKYGIRSRFWAIHNPDKSQNIQTALISEGSIKPASIRSITVGSVPSACAHTNCGKAHALKTKSTLTHKVGQTDDRNNSATTANQ